MALPPNGYDEFLHFLIKAKHCTYASQDDEATVSPLIPGSKQLEWRNGSWLYRDMYFGMAYFVGQETVSFQGQPRWSMSYAGGVSATVMAKEEIGRIYAFLRSAMRQVSQEHPYRGPAYWQQEDYLYIDKHWGGLEAFWGREVITYKKEEVYELRYSGGFLR